ncbi:MAG: di-trans,poly-cis-decaprenylcistransferase, partial [Microbacteriaceae bacterium]|nr:di-trans,poly-cis-decaprenylcistransferase [Microbacteriaceae bacterium]
MKKPKFDGNVPQHVAIVMDGNGRWANARGLTRVEGHRAGEAALMDVIEGAIQAGVKYLSVFAFSTENWKRSPDEVKFLMNYNREVLRRRRDQLDSWNVKIRWVGRRPRLWPSVVDELITAEKKTKRNTGLVFTMCVNYGSRQEILDALTQMIADHDAGKLPEKITEKTMQKYLLTSDLPDVDLFIRSSGEQRISNYLLWQSAYAEFVFMDVLWPDFNREHLWQA